VLTVKLCDLDQKIWFYHSWAVAGFLLGTYRGTPGVFFDSFIEVSSRLWGYWCSHDDVINQQRGKTISNIFSVRRHRTL